MKESIKKKLEILDTVINIILSVGAMVGFLLVYKSRFSHKLYNVVTYFHEQINL